MGKHSDGKGPTGRELELVGVSVHHWTAQKVKRLLTIN